MLLKPAVYRHLLFNRLALPKDALHVSSPPLLPYSCLCLCPGCMLPLPLLLHR